MTDHRQVKVDVTLLRALQGIRRPSALLFSRQRISAGGASWCGGLFAAFDRWHDEGQLSSDQVLDDPHAVKATIEPRLRRCERLAGFIVADRMLWLALEQDVLARMTEGICRSGTPRSRFRTPLHSIRTPRLNLKSEEGLVG